MEEGRSQPATCSTLFPKAQWSERGLGTKGAVINSSPLVWSSALSLPMVGRAPPVLRAVYNRVTRHPSRTSVEGRRNSTYEAAWIVGSSDLSSNFLCLSDMSKRYLFSFEMALLRQIDQRYFAVLSGLKNGTMILLSLVNRLGYGLPVLCRWIVFNSFCLLSLKNWTYPGFGLYCLIEPLYPPIKGGQRWPSRVDAFHSHPLYTD